MFLWVSPPHAVGPTEADLKSPASSGRCSAHYLRQPMTEKFIFFGQNSGFIDGQGNNGAKGTSLGAPSV